MLDLAKQIINFYITKNKIPTKNDLDITDNTLLERKWNLFVTIYKNWNIVWNSWNIVEIENDIVNELIKNTIFALWDKRFPDLTSDDLDKIKIRIDIINNRVLLNDKKVSELNPVKSWVLAIKKDYNKLAIVLPNISSSLTSWDDFIDILSNKLSEEFKEENFIIYEIQTEVLTDF